MHPILDSPLLHNLCYTPQFTKQLFTLIVATKIQRNFEYNVWVSLTNLFDFRRLVEKEEMK